MADLRGYELLLTGATTLVTETCYKCGVVFAMTKDYRDNRLRKRDNFYCPNGHDQHYLGKTPEQKLRDAEAREVALQDQLSAAIRDTETTKAALLRDRARFAAGVCPCCTRSFENVRRHMQTQHPDFDVTRLDKHAPEFRCSCGDKFETYRGLRIHQGKQRATSAEYGEPWDAPDQDRFWSHLTEVKV